MAPRLNFRHLEMFRLLMKTKNLTETARQLRISQPAVSQALRELEAQLGLTLFFRASGRVRPTAEALDLLPAADRLFGQINVFASTADDLKSVQGGRLDVAAIPALALSGLPQAIERFRKQRPMSHVLLQSVGTSEVIAAVKEEEVDLGFVATPIQDPSVGVEPLLETEFCCYLPASHPLAEQKAISADQIIDETIVALSTQSPPGQAFRNALIKSKKAHLVRVETNNAFAALAMVEAGAGIAVLDPFPFIGRGPQALVVRPFRPSVALTVAAVVSRHRATSRIELQFIEHVRSTLHGYVEALQRLGIAAKGL